MQPVDSLALASPVLPDVAAPKVGKLHTAAQQFEALMIGEMLKAAREDSQGGWLGEDADSGSESAMDLAQSQFASGLASRGGLGLAAIIEKTMAPKSSEAQNAAEKPGATSAGSSK